MPRREPKRLPDDPHGFKGRVVVQQFTRAVLLADNPAWDSLPPQAKLEILRRVPPRNEREENE